PEPEPEPEPYVPEIPGGLANKEVVLFATHFGTPGNTLERMREECSVAENVTFGPTALFEFDEDGGPNMITPEEEVDAWIQQLVDLYCQPDPEEETEGENADEMAEETAAE
ncbi:MAG: hypothetical protein J6Y65_01165, partial [Eggerthellaceae bacterium]|nr:hypothetical protein [Eggerthellaceae bacterium]